VRHVADILHQPPGGPGLIDDAEELKDQAVPLGRVPMPIRVGIVLAGWSADHPIESTRRGVEVLDSLIEDQIGASNDTVTGHGKRAAQ
jgi:hypothetical protein